MVASPSQEFSNPPLTTVAVRAAKDNLLVVHQISFGNNINMVFANLNLLIKKDFIERNCWNAADLNIKIKYIIHLAIFRNLEEKLRTVVVDQYHIILIRN